MRNNEKIKQNMKKREFCINYLALKDKIEFLKKLLL